jgi:hypothetical protein
MSSYDDAALTAETEQQQQKGEGAFLSQEERQQVRRILKFPEEFPRELGAWVEDYMGTHGNFQKSQVQGLPLLFTQMQETLQQQQDIIEQLAVIGTTYTDEETSVSIDGFSGALPYDPTVSVPAGTYFCILTGQAEITAGGGDITMRMFNGETDTAFGSTAYWADSTASGERQMLISIGSVTLTAADQIRMYANETGNGNRIIYSAALVAVRTA